MRVFVFFDLPTVTIENMRNYRSFRKHLIKNGFIMMQESVYCRMALNQTAANLIVENVKKNKPPEGIVQILSVTEKQFSKMEFITGSFETDVVNNDKRLVIL